MNVLQALSALDPPLEVHDATPDPRPAGAYAVVSEPADGEERPLFASEGGQPRQVRELTLLVTLYGPQGSEVPDLRPLYHAVRDLPDRVTRHPGIPTLTGTRLGACLPPRYDGPLRRPWCGVRLTLQYLE